MPELPEIETIKKGLEKNILNKKVKKITISGKKLRKEIPSSVLHSLNFAKIISIQRRAKIIIINFNNGLSLLMHLGMSGKIIFDLSSIKEHLHKHNHFIMTFSDSSYLIFNDIRRFGFIDLIKTKDLNKTSYINKLAPEPFSKEFNKDYLKRKLKNKKIAIKASIMDNSIVVGVGNIYASESLFLAKINPFKASNSLTDKELNSLINAIKTTLESAIKQGGTTLRDYIHTDGTLGYFQNNLNVYNQENKKCSICQTLIKKETIAQRSTYFCPNCQK